MDTTEIPQIGTTTMMRISRSMHDKTLIEILMEVAREHGPIFQLPGPAPRRSVVSNFALTNELCDEQRFDKELGPGLQDVRKMAGDGLFTARTDEPNWHKAHNILLPAFSRQAMKNYLPQMLDLASQLMLKWQRLNADDEIEVPQDMTRLTLDTIGLCGFDYRFNSFYRTDQHPFVAAMVDSLTRATEKQAIQAGAGGHPLVDTLMETLTRWVRPSHTADTPDPEAQHDRDVMNALVDEVIQARKAGGPEAIAAHHDLLSLMLTGVDKQSGEGLADQTIRYEIITFLIAGHETTSGLLSFAIYFLLKHPDIVARAYGEVDSVLGSDLSVLPTYEQVHQLTYISQILKESLRLWPTAPAFTRHALQDTTLDGKYNITPEDIFMVLIPMLHRDKTVWGDDAEEFNPDHFSPEAERARPANAFKPFGSGQRACIGREFALQEAALVLGMLLQRFEFIDFENYQLQLKQTLTIKPDNFKIKIRLRTQRSIQVSPPAATRVAVRTGEAAPAAGGGTGAEGSHNTPLLVLYGSNLGTAEDLAHQIANGGAARGYAPTVAPLDDYTNKLPTAGAIIIVSSSYNGTPPDDANKFCAWLRDPALAGNALQNVRYTVFGCGNHEWSATYQAIPTLIDSKLEEHGAQRIYPRGEGDAAGDFDDEFQTWYRPLWKALGQALSIEAAAIEAEPVVAAPGTLYSVERVTAPANPVISANGVIPLTIRINRELQKVNGADTLARSTRHIEVVLPKGTTYQTGDHLGVLPRNSVPLLQRVLKRFNLAGDAYVRIHRNGNGTPVLPLDQPVALVDLLSHYVELQEVASRTQMTVLADYTKNPQESARLLQLADDAHYPQEILAKRVTVLDLLEMFPSCDLPFNVYLELLHPLRVRYYSISSSPLGDGHTPSITVSVINDPARSGQGIYQGVCSTYLAHHGPDSVIDGFIHSPHMPFRPPEEPLKPIIMIGPGTGVAPFRGFLQERAARQARGEQLGKALLFFGCRHPDQDFLYKDELEAFAAQGVVTLYPAFSRVEGQPKTYVQDVIKAHADEVWQLIQDGATIYVCGDGGKMEPEVRKAFTDLYQERTRASAQDADSWQVDLRDKQRYLADVWANG
jgi:cytochrome P450 / NADPH-cytochrome P450 reductase